MYNLEILYLVKIIILVFIKIRKKYVGKNQHLVKIIK